MKTINIDSVDIDIHDKSVSLSFSGGADSALLLYILLTNTAHTLHVYTFASRAKQFRTAVSSSRVLAACCGLTGNYQVEHHIVYIDQQTPEIIWPDMHQQQRRDGTQCLYTAMTRLPPVSVYSTFTEQLSQWVIDRRADQEVRPVYTNMGRTYSPFINLNKQDIARMYDHLALQTTLYPLTLSCEGTLGHNEQPCGSCWWCDERSWAFGCQNSH